jgi:hypothetical protein
MFGRMKQKNLLVHLAIIVATVLSLFFSPIDSSLTARATMGSNGSISYHTSTNLATIPTFFSGDITGGYAPYASVSYTTTHNGNPSIRIGPDYSSRQTREVDGKWVNIHPGDHVIFSCWIKTDSFSGTTYPWSGGRIGIDLYIPVGDGSVSIIDDGHPTDQESSKGICVVGWGKDWTKVTWDFVVPSTVYYSAREWISGQLVTIPIPNGAQIGGCIVWLDARELKDSAYAYFADSELYIN